MANQASGNFPRVEEILFRGLVWAFVGAIFGFLFLVAREYLRELLAAPLRDFAATCAAAAFTSMIYGSMRLTVIIGNISFIVMLVYVGASPQDASLTPLIFIGGSLGLCLGALYGWQDKHSNIFRADAKLVAGIASALPASLCLSVPVWLTGDIGYPWATIIVTPVVVLLYVSSAHWFVRRCCDILPPAGDGALVGLAVGLITGVAFMLMAASLDASMMEAYQAMLARIYAGLPPAVGGAAVASFILGVARAILHVRWYDL